MNPTLIKRVIWFKWGYIQTGKDYIFVSEDEGFVKNRTGKDKVIVHGL